MSATIIEEAIFNRLSGFAGLTALVSTRIHPVLAGAVGSITPPLVVYSKISGPRIADLSGAVGMAQPRFQFDCYAVTFLGANAVATQVRYALDGYRATDGSVVIQGCSLLDERDGIEDGMSPPERWFRCSMDYRISHTEATS